MKNKIASFLPLSFLIVAAVACSSSIGPGSALLPEGIEQAQLPDTDLSGFAYLHSGTPVSVATERFLSSEQRESASNSTSQFVDIQGATVAVGTSPEEFSGTLELASAQDAQVVWQLLQPQIEREDVWAVLASPQLLIVRGSSPWTRSARRKLESGQFVSPSEYDTQSWNLITNLPMTPPSQPIAAGVVELDELKIEALGDKTGVILDGIDSAFEFVSVDALAFGVYASKPIEIPDTIDDEFLKESGYGVLLVSKSGYPGFLVSFILGVAAGRAGLETIDIGGTSAQYRTIEDGHLVIKNRGSLLFAALAGTRKEAETLLMTAISE